MLTTFHASLGGGHAGAHVDVNRDPEPSRNRRLGVVALLLVMPIVVVIGAQAIGTVTGWYSLDRVMNAPGAPWVTVLAASTLCALLAVAVLSAARLRLTASHRDGTWQLAVTLRLNTAEMVALGVAVILIALFCAHLLADGIACARGVREAC